MRKLLNSDVKIITLLFFLWKAILLASFFMAFHFVPLAGGNFLGGGLQNYLSNPLLFAWANFDGEHYLSIAQIGYRGLEQAFFPVYPALMHFFAQPFGISITFLTISGLLISNVSFIAALFFFYKLLRLDYSKYLSFLTISVLLMFPTSFYFSAVYSESLFLLLSVLSFYFARKDKWFWASIFGAISSATRIFGIILLPALILEAWQQKKSRKEIFWIILIPIGLAAYIFYQWITVGDPLAFYHLQKIVGPQHESGITLLTQVYFRYIKMLLTVDFTNPIFHVIVLEFFVGILFFLLPIYGYFKKVRISYLFFGFVGFLLPTVQGSFSSVPRYIMILFPSFLCLAIFVRGWPLFIRVIIMLSSIIWLMFGVSLFLRGYWVA